MTQWRPTLISIAFAIWVASVAAQPVVTAIVPGSGCPGDSVLVIGGGFAGGIQVIFRGNAANPSDDQPAAITLLAATLLRVQIPAQAVTGNLILVSGADTLLTSQTVTVRPVPSASPSALGGATRCQGDTLLLRANPSGGTPPYAFQWSPSGSLSSNTVQNPAFAATTAGVFPLAVVVRDNNGCESPPGALSLTINPRPAQPTISGPAVVCGGATATFTVTNPAAGQTYAWTATGGTPAPGSLPSRAVAFNPSAGPFQVRSAATLTSTGCQSNPGLLNGSIQAPPQTNLTAGGPTTYLLNTSAILPVTGTPGNGLLSSAFPGLVNTVNPGTLNIGAISGAAGVYPVVYAFSDPLTGCSGSDTLRITILDPASDICGLDSVFCISGPAQLVFFDVGACPTLSALFPNAGLVEISVFGPGVTELIPGSLYEFDPLAAGGPGFVTLFATFTQITPFFSVQFVARTVRLKALPAPFAPDVVSCDGGPIPAVSASGGTGPYSWYDNPALTQPPLFVGNPFNPPVQAVGVTPYFTTYTSDGCQSFPGNFSVSTGPRPNPPVLPQDTLRLCANQQPDSLQISVTGTDVRWYRVLANGAQGPLTSLGPQLLGYVNTPGVTSRFFVSQTQNGCESPFDTLTLIARAALDARFTTLDPTYCRPANPDSILLIPLQAGNPGLVSVFEGPGVVQAGANWYWILSEADSGENIISHLITDDLNCFEESFQRPVLFNSAVIGLTGLRERYCQNADTVFLQVTGRYNTFGLNLAPAPAQPALLPAPDGALFVPGNAAIGPNTLTVQYADIFGCTGNFSLPFRILPQPVAAAARIEERICLGNELTFSSLSTIAPPGEIDSTFWDFGDGAFASGITATHAYQVERAFLAQLSVVSDSGCTDQFTIPLNVQAFPDADFFWENVCEGQRLTFINRTTPPNRPFGYLWDLGSELASEAENPVFDDLPSGAYRVKLLASTSNGCEDSVAKRVLVHPVVAVTDQNPYLDDFEAATDWLPSDEADGEGGWSWTQTALDSSFGVINRVRSGLQAWITDRNALPNPEASFLNSPCFDLRALNRPMVAFLSWTDASPSLEGAALQFAPNGGNQWRTLGSPRNGIGWYENERIIVRPGGVANDSLFGWSHRFQTDWQDSRYRLDELLDPLGRDSTVRFRFAFASFANIDPATSGFAIDSFWIGNRTKQVLTEFVGPFSGEAPNRFQEVIAQTQAADPLDVRAVQYLFPEATGDPDLQALRADAYFARSIFYKIPDEGAYAVLDGNQFNAPFSLLRQPNLDRRMLETPRLTFETLSFDPTTSEIKASIRAGASPLTQLVAYTVGLSPQYTRSSGASFRQLALGMAPGPDGVRIPDLGPGGSASFSVPLRLPRSVRDLIDGDSVEVLVFIQNLLTGEVYQTDWLHARLEEVAERRSGLPPAQAVDQGLHIYPNPVSDRLFVALPQESAPVLHWQITDLGGAIVAQGVPNPVERTWDISTRMLASGMYQLVLYFSDGSKQALKVVVLFE